MLRWGDATYLARIPAQHAYHAVTQLLDTGKLGDGLYHGGMASLQYRTGGVNAQSPWQAHTCVLAARGLQAEASNRSLDAASRLSISHRGAAADGKLVLVTFLARRELLFFGHLIVFQAVSRLASSAMASHDDGDDDGPM